MGGQGCGSERREEVRLRIIRQEAEGVLKSLPTYFRRLDAFENEDHPSIFKRRQQDTTTTNQHVPVDGEEPRQPPQATMAATTGRDIMVAAVGPYHHHHHHHTLITRGKKCGIVVFLADRFSFDAAGFLRWAAANEARARRCYARESVAMGPEDLAEMLLLDGCLVLFAVFLLRRSVREDQRPAALARHREHGTQFVHLSADISLHMKQTRLDLLMLDNQIPFFVLAELHRRLKRTLFHEINHSIQELALSCFDDIHPAPAGGASTTTTTPNDDEFPVFPPQVHHLLHLFHWSRVPRGKHSVGVSSFVPKEPEPHLPCATELRESLTRLKKKAAAAAATTGTARASRCSSLDISFQRDTLGTCAVMAIPPLCVHNYSDRVFRSLIAFEQNHLRCGLGATAYSICMARLLQSEADVRLLRKKGILMHTQKTDREIVDFFRGLRDEYADTCLPDDLLRLCKQVAAHQQSRAARIVARVGRQCFPRQTVTFFVIVGTIISIATLVNTIHSMYRYYHPFKGVNPP